MLERVKWILVSLQCISYTDPKDEVQIILRLNDNKM